MRRTTILLALAAGLAAPCAVAGPLKYSIVALAGRQVPGMPAGVSFADSGLPLISPTGTICTPIFISGPGISTANDTGAIAGPLDNYVPLYQEGIQAPGLPAGVTIGDPRACLIDEAGRIMLIAALAGPGVTAADDRAIWTGPLASLSLLLREGSPAPGTGVNFGDFGNPTTSGDYGYLGGVPTVFSPLSGAGVTTANDYASFAGSPLTLLAREGSPAPGVAANFGTPPICMRNAPGTVLLYTALSGTGNSALWYGTPGALTPIIHVGDPAPGLPGVTIASISTSPDLDANGRIVFICTLAGNVTTANDAAAYIGTPPGYILLARKGDQAPGLDPGVVYSTLSAAHVQSTGPVTLDGQVSGPGVTTANSRCVWLGSAGNLSLVARGGQQAPGQPAGVLYSAFVGSCPDRDGRVAFIAILTGQGITTANDQAYFGSNRMGQLSCIAQENTPMNLDATTVFTPTLITSKIGNSENGKQTTFAAGYLGVGMISGAGNATIVADLDSTCRADFTDHPLSYSLPAGIAVTLSGAVVGPGPITFRWRHNGIDMEDGPTVSGTATPTLHMHSLAPADAGEYRLAATNPCGLSLSNPGTITVSAPVCYPNCDASTIAPVLNVQDFTCFLNRFGSGDTWANCDGSTTAPTLNIQDFTCFLNRFGAGCS